MRSTDASSTASPSMHIGDKTMTNNTALSTFTFPVTAAQIRTVTDENGDPWFVAKDVAEALGYADTDKAIRTHCKRAQTYPAISAGLGLVNPQALQAS